MSVTEGLFTVYTVLYLCSLSAYDIVITTYNLLTKEIPTQKQEGATPGADHGAEKVSLGTAREAGATPPLTGVFLQPERRRGAFLGGQAWPELSTCGNKEFFPLFLLFYSRRTHR